MIPSIVIIMLSIKSNLMITNTNNNAVIRIDITLITIKESNLYIILYIIHC